MTKKKEEVQSLSLDSGTTVPSSNHPSQPAAAAATTTAATTVAESNEVNDVSLEGIEGLGSLGKDDDDDGQNHMVGSSNTNVGGAGSAAVQKAVFVSSVSNRAAIEEPVKTVSAKRKEELLLEARKERIKWIQQAPLPYAIPNMSCASVEETTTDDDPLSSLKSSHAGNYLPTALSVLHVLYNNNNNNNTSLTEGSKDVTTATTSTSPIVLRNEDTDLAFPTGNQILASEMKKATANNNNNNKDQEELLKHYHAFLLKLQDPLCGMIVQGMRNFCRSVQSTQTVEELASKLKSYLASTMATLQTHSVWKTRTGKSSFQEMTETEKGHVKRALESFIYAHCQSHIRQIVLLRRKRDATKETAWNEKLQALQFVQPKHLEIACLDNDQHFSQSDLDQLLKDPMDAILSVDLYHSVYEKLQRILLLYRGVNAVLSKALNKHQHQQQHHGGGGGGGGNNKNSSNNQKLPSADDILPTIIYVVLRAQPANLFVNLQLVEELSPPEYLRGEAGYAFTNLYGAVHFLEELNLSEEPKRLSITSEELKEGLNRWKQKAQTKVESLSKATTNDDGDDDDEQQQQQRMEENHLLAASRIPPIEIRKARRNGETIDVNWALQWHEKNGYSISDVLKEEEKKEDNLITTTTTTTFDESSYFPAGFQRNYSFLACRPEDIRVTDLPKLLSEYKMLVHATETLIAEKVNLASKTRKAKVAAKEQKLFATAREIDPSLLPKK